MDLSIRTVGKLEPVSGLTTEQLMFQSRTKCCSGEELKNQVIKDYQSRVLGYTPPREVDNLGLEISCWNKSGSLEVLFLFSLV